MKKTLTEIDAYIYGHKIGTLIWHEGTIYFEYDKTFKALELEISPLKLDTKKTTGLYTNQESKYLYGGMPGVFFDSLPDKYGMAFIDRYFERQGLRLSEITLLHKLAFIGDRGMGAIEYRPQEHEESSDIESVLEAKDAYEDMKKFLDSKDAVVPISKLMTIIDSVSPVGGGRPKMLVLYNPSTNTIKFNNKKLDNGDKRALIKFDEVYYEKESLDFTKLEYVYMQMAKECGIETPPFTLYQEDGQSHLIVERFDRDKNDNKIHMCTASGLMHKDISVPKIMSYEELFLFTSKICSNQSTLEQLFRRMIFNALSINYDDHAKNFAFIMDQTGNWALSPAYDITFSKGLAQEHITTIGGKGKSFILDDFLSVATKHLIKEATALKIIKEIATMLHQFEVRAKEININTELIEECTQDIQEQLALIKL